MGERVKDVYVTWERYEKEVYVMREMRKRFMWWGIWEKIFMWWGRWERGLCDEREGKKYLCDEREGKEVYVMREMRKNIYVMREMRKNIYVMRDMRKNIYVMREMRKRFMWWEIWERGLCDEREGVPTTNLPPPKRVFSPTPPPLENRKRVFTSNI